MTKAEINAALDALDQLVNYLGVEQVDIARAVAANGGNISGPLRMRIAQYDNLNKRIQQRIDAMTDRINMATEGINPTPRGRRPRRR